MMRDIFKTTTALLSAFRCQNVHARYWRIATCRYLLTRVFGLAVLLSLGAAAAPPNLVLIYADDLGWKDVGYNGSDYHETPNLDRMARAGMIFHHAYAAAGNCAPSRASLHSGTYSPRHHVFAVGSTSRGQQSFQRLIPIPNKSGLAPDNVTLADALKSAGYATGIFGKWHLDGKEGASPGEQGFEVVFDSQKSGPNKRLDRPEDPKGIFSITAAAGDFMEKSKAAGKPFFAFVSHHGIHTGLEARPGSLGKFKGKAAGKQHHDPLYAACLYDLDDGVGKLLARINELGLAENTLLVFTSDNGGTPQSSQEPLRGSKGGYYEGGIREPFIAHWPGMIQAGSESQVPVHQVDLFPTFLAAAGAAVPAGKVLDGENLLPLLKRTGTLPRGTLFWHFPGYLDNPVMRGRESDVRLGFRSRPVTVIRKGDWKLHLFHEEWQLDGGRAKFPANGAVELYDLAKDPGERNNLAASELTKANELLDDLLGWIKSTSAPLPDQLNPNYNPQAAAKALASTSNKKR